MNINVKSQELLLLLLVLSPRNKRNHMDYASAFLRCPSTLIWA